MDVLYRMEVCGCAYFGACIRDHCIHRPHHCLVNSRTWHLDFQDFQGPLIFPDFPDTGNFTNTISGLSRRRENPVQRILWITLWAWLDQVVTVVDHPCWLTSRGGGLEGHVARGDSRQCPCKHGYQQEVTARYSVQTESKHCNRLYVLLLFLIC